MDFQFPVKPPAFNIMLKPAGPACNLNCAYCYYLEKQKLYPDKSYRLDEGLLEKFIREYIAAQDVPLVSFVWQGGEPTLLGVDYFRKAVELQNKYAGGKQIENALQTNGTLLTDTFCEFLKENQFLVGLSIDGPRHLHDLYRVNKQGKPSWDSVMQGVELLKKHGVDFNTMSVINRTTAEHPLEVYRFMKQIGSTFMQFLPIVERIAVSPEENELRLVHQKFTGEAAVSPWSVTPKQYGDFLTAIFDEWVRQDVGRYYVQMFDVTLANWVGASPGLCVFSETCGTAAVMEHNGDVYTCDHYVYPDHFLGNIKEKPVSTLLASTRQAMFGQAKKSQLPAYCRQCDYLYACHGACPKHRILHSPDGEPGLNYLCKGFKQFFSHVKPYMDFMAKELKAKRPPANVMQWIKNKESQHRAPILQVGRNETCPCGSGKKFKRCHGKQS